MEGTLCPFMLHTLIQQNLGNFSVSQVIIDSTRPHNNHDHIKIIHDQLMSIDRVAQVVGMSAR
jgi:hypothetical protein